MALCETVPDKPSSPYAMEGSVAHALAEICLSRDLHPTHFLGAPIEHPEGDPPKGWSDNVVTQDMCDAVVVYLNAVAHEIAQSKDSIYFVEQGFVLDIDAAEDGEVFGTNDCLVYHPETGRLRVFDYKHGAGVNVSADDNAQLKFYAAGAVFSNPDWKIKQVVLTIVQPRARGDEETDGVKDWTFDVVELLEFMAEVNEGVALAKDVTQGRAVSGKFIRMTDNLDAPEELHTGSHCRWCAASPICPAREAEVLAAAQLDFADMTKLTTDDLPIVSEIDAERLGQILKAGALLNDWLATVQEYVEGLLMGGKEVPGWKVVEKIGRAKWTSAEEEVADYAAMLYEIELDQIRPRKLTSIGDAEKLLKAAGATKSQIDDFKLKFTLKESSGLTMAPSSDRRPAVDALAADFAGVQT